MKEDKSDFEKSVETLRNQQVPPGPSRELVDETIRKLTETSKQPNTVNLHKQHWFIERLKAANSFSKVAAAAVLLIVASFAAGRLSTPRQPDIAQIQAAMEPAIREQLLGEMKQYLQLGLTNCYVRLKDDLTQQYRSDLGQYASQTMAASSAMTNQLLKELIVSINAAQAQDRQWVAGAIEQLELNRLRDNAKWNNALMQVLSYNQTDNLVPSEFENTNDLNERSNK
ncbi:MAG: hypothetical protein PVH77_03615 [Phycisphaerales bacterium]|jgi:hypothetical protein